MKDIDNIEDWYRDELNNYNVEPDTNIWNSLSEDLDADAPLTDENISEWYKKEVTKLEERPDYTVWERLSTKLDTSSVWDKLIVSLNRYDQFIWWRNLAFRGSAVFLLFFGSYLAYDSYSNSDNLIANDDISNNQVVINNDNVTNKNSTSSTYETAFNSPSENLIKSNANYNNIPTNNELISSAKKKNKRAATINNSSKEISPTAAKKRSRSKYSHSYASLDKIEEYYKTIYKSELDELKTEKEHTIFTEINRHHLTEQDISHLYSSGDFLVKKDKNKIVFNSKRFSSYFIYGVYARRLYVGLNVGVKKQGMITNIKKNSDLAKYNQNSFLDFGTNFGATIGYIVSDKFNIEANINVNSTGGYKRAFNAEGVAYQENLNLNYTSINLLAKKMNNKSTFDNKVYSTNIIGGVYVSYLRSAISDANGISRKLDDYNTTDVGIVLGIEQDRYITKTLVITPGVRYNQGLTNIANDNSPFESSRNFSFEFNLGIKYIFLKKSK